MSEGTGTTEKGKQPAVQDQRTHTTSTTTQDAQTQPLMFAGVLSQGDKRGLDVISRDVMGSEPAAGDKRSTLDAPDTDDDDGCAEQSDGAGAVEPKPEQSGTRNKNLR